MINKLKHLKARISNLINTVDKNYELLKEIRTCLLEQNNQNKQLVNRLETQNEFFA